MTPSFYMRRAGAPMVAYFALAGGLSMLFLLGALLAVPPTSTRAASTCPGRNGVIAVKAGGNPKNIIGILAPGNKRLQPVYEGEVFGAGSEGGEEAGRLTHIYGPSFSCDGSWISFVERNGLGWSYLKLVSVTTKEVRIVKTPELQPGGPAFLSDGRIVFQATRGALSQRGGTFVVNADGSHLQRLFSRKEIAVTADGRWFVAGGKGEKPRSFYLLDARGRAVRRLAPLAPVGSFYLNPHFSPDGRWIVYEERHELKHHPFIHDVLYMVRRDGTHRRRLTWGRESASEPTFSPDGRWVAFTRSKEGPSGNLFALSVKNPRRMKQLGLSDAYQDPTWASR